MFTLEKMVFQKSFKTPTSGGNTMARVTASVALWWSYGTAISGCPVCTERIGCYWPTQHLPVATVPLQVAASRPSSGLPAHEIIPSSAWQSHSPRLIWRVSSPGCPLFDCFNPSQENCNIFFDLDHHPKQIWWKIVENDLNILNM